ncbi:MAG: site-specific integrase, partial [Glaciimonas sp.]|nr:site-specific integrase [Glaciimonas sp.]
MATKRQRSSGSFEYILKNKALLPKPISLTFDNEEEGDAYVEKLEALLKAGIVPTEFQQDASKPRNIRECIAQYIAAVSVPDSDKTLLKVCIPKVGSVSLVAFDYAYVENWVQSLKVESNLAPSTIRHYVGALARCLDWVMRRRFIAVNPIRMLPRRYASYNESDVVLVAKKGGSAKIDIERDRRLERNDEIKIIKIFDGQKEKDKERPFELRRKAALWLIFV